MATDPVCGMKVQETQAAATVVYQGNTYYFCSGACHKAFMANPAHYAKAAGAAAGDAQGGASPAPRGSASGARGASRSPKR